MNAPLPDPALWQPLDDELAAWAATGRTARLWLRDDDAVGDTPALRTLTGLTEDFGIPLLLAAIPAHTDASLARRVDATPTVTPAVHGWAHVNHAPAGAKAQELGLHRPRETVLAELDAGLNRLRALFGARLAPLLVPPWNRIAPELLADLPDLGYRHLSTFSGTPLPGLPAGLVQLDARLDLIDWKNGRRCRTHTWLVRELATQLAQARADDGAPVGVLTHHLAHDTAAWDFLVALFAFTRPRADVRWVAVAGPDAADGAAAPG